MKDILKVLEDDARTPHAQIAVMTGRPVEEVDRIIKEAEDNGTIAAYRTLVNWEKLGEQQVWALIEVKITPQRDVGFDAVAERIFNFPETRDVYLVSGTYDLAVVVVAKDIYEVSRFVSNRLSTIEGVQGTVSHFLLKRYKEDNVILQGKAESKRQPLVH